MDAERVLRSQRHSFLNHLQVISGWLQLGRAERAYEYLEGVAAQLSAESAVLLLVPEALAVTVMALRLEAEQHGVWLDWHVQPPVSADDAAGVERMRRQVLVGIEASARLPEVERRLAVRLGPGENVVVHTPAVRGEG